MKNILTQTSDGIITVILSRPQALNALNIELLDDLREVVKAFYETSESKAMIITGEGEKAFVAGADIKEFSAVDAAGAKAFAERGQSLFNLIAECPKPILAAVNGFALGGGCELAMACHMRIATTNAKFGQPEVTLGIIPGYGGTQRLPQLVGRGKALELMMTAAMINADEAKSIGLVNHVVADKTELMNLSNSILKKILSNGPFAVGHVIKSVNAGYSFEGKGYDNEAENFAACISTSDFKEGTEAFIAKRKPAFTGK